MGILQNSISTIIWLVEKRNVVGDRVRQARKVARPPITQIDLVARLQVLGMQIDQSGLSKIESGRRRAVPSILGYQGLICRPNPQIVGQQKGELFSHQDAFRVLQVHCSVNAEFDNQIPWIYYWWQERWGSGCPTASWNGKCRVKYWVRQDTIYTET